MATKTVTISARISREDAEFISQLAISGATTPSDKIRAIITETRLRHTGAQDYPGCLAIVNGLVAPLATFVREQEHIESMHSELVIRILEWLPDMMAFAMASVNTEHQASGADVLQELEEGVADRVFRLMEFILPMGITRRGPCYNEQAIQERLDPILDLTRVMEMASQR
mgnify:CR=1 FL=1